MKMLVHQNFSKSGGLECNFPPLENTINGLKHGVQRPILQWRALGSVSVYSIAARFKIHEIDHGISGRFDIVFFFSAHH